MHHSGASEKLLTLEILGGGQGYEEAEVCDTLNIYDNTETRTPIVIVEKNECAAEVFDATRRHSYESLGEVGQTVQAHYGTGGNNVPVVVEPKKEDVVTVVRRLTPLECTRLQGFPDGWVDIGEWVDSKGKVHQDSDSAKYKALGNSIALPFWEWLMSRIADHLHKDGIKNPTMASLFDGIGGFPLASQRNGIEPVWASEIEEFPIAVTKLRFPENKENRSNEENLEEDT